MVRRPVPCGAPRCPPMVSFSGHETFPIRYPWPAKAVEATDADPEVFQDDRAIATFGVGRNMVRAIRHWGLAAEVLEADGRGRVVPTDLGRAVFGLDGADLYCEDPGTAWLLHWLLCRDPARATLWHFVFGHWAGRSTSGGSAQRSTRGSPSATRPHPRTARSSATSSASSGRTRSKRGRTPRTPSPPRSLRSGSSPTRADWSSSARGATRACPRSCSPPPSSTTGAGRGPRPRRWPSPTSFTGRARRAACSSCRTSRRSTSLRASRAWATRRSATPTPLGSSSSTARGDAAPPDLLARHYAAPLAA